MIALLPCSIRALAQRILASLVMPMMAIGCWGMLSSEPRAEDGSVQRGREIAEANCAGCHAIGGTGDSPLAMAPPFRTLHQRYPVESLAEALSEGIVTGHAEMPQFVFESPQIEDFIYYLKSLEK